MGECKLNRGSYTECTIQYRVRREKRRAALYGMTLLLFLVGVVLGIYYSLQSQIYNTSERKQWYELHDMSREINKELNAVISDLLYFSESELAHDVLINNDTLSQTYLTQMMLRIAEVQKRYDQLRIFDTSGYEIIRINLDDDGIPYVVSDDKLQNKRDRYYFKDAYTLDSNIIYSSRLDLNIEHGKVEYPFKPVIRFGRPIVSSDGEKIGVASINFLGEHIMNLLQEMNEHEGDQVMLISYDGYYLIGPDDESQWGFMLPERAHRSLFNEYPTVWEHMQHHDSGHISTPSGEFYYTHMDLDLLSGMNLYSKGVAKLVMFVSRDVFFSETNTLRQGLGIGFIIVAPLLFFLGWKLGRYQVNKSCLLCRLKMEATHDTLTGLFNRKAFMDYLKREIKRVERSKKPLSLCFIDVNDLKKMNDIHGHEMGDQLIVSAAKAMTGSIRNTDIAARVGGDEFMVLFPECSQESAEIVVNRMQLALASSGLNEVQQHWSFSFGCVELESTNETPESFLSRADKKMYSHKIQQKSEKGETPR